MPGAHRSEFIGKCMVDSVTELVWQLQRPLGKIQDKPARTGQVLSPLIFSFSNLSPLVSLLTLQSERSVRECLSHVGVVLFHAFSDGPYYLLFLPITSVNPSSSTLGWTFSLGAFTSAGASPISTSPSLSPSALSTSSLSQSVSSSSSSLVIC